MIDLRNSREAKGMSQGELAKKLGLSSPQFVSNMERGLCGVPITTLRRLGKMFKWSAQEMYEFKLNEHAKKLKKVFKVQ